MSVFSRFPVCQFYLVLRALDTVEDDMTIPVGEKVAMLKSFYTHLEEPGWSYTGCQDKDKIVLENFATVNIFLHSVSHFGMHSSFIDV